MSYSKITRIEFDKWSDGSGNDHHLACPEPHPKDMFNRITRVRLPLLGESFKRPELRQPESLIHRCVKGEVRNHQSDSSHVLIALAKYNSRISQGIVKEITLEPYWSY